MELQGNWSGLIPLWIIGAPFLAGVIALFIPSR